MARVVVFSVQFFLFVRNTELSWNNFNKAIFSGVFFLWVDQAKFNSVFFIQSLYSAYRIDGFHLHQF